MAFAGLVPWRRDPFELIRSDFDRMFERMADRLNRFVGEGAEGAWSPDFSLAENDKEYMLLVELPGVDEKDVKLDVTSNSVSIHGEKKYESELKGARYLYGTRGEGVFERVVSLPTAIAPDKVRARYRKGILEVSLPKLETSVTKSIPIEAGDKK